MSANNVQWIRDRLRNYTGERAADEFTTHIQLVVSVAIAFNDLTITSRFRVCYVAQNGRQRVAVDDERLESLERRERETCVGYHANHGDCVATIERNDAVFLLEIIESYQNLSILLLI